MDIRKVQEFHDQFCNDRDWGKYHTPKNLAMALNGEAGELIEIFQWLSPEESWKVMETSKTAEMIRDELADVLIYTARLAHLLKVDLEDAVWAKFKKNEVKYPVHLAKGNAKKYTDL